ncbi:MAG TPA: D-glycerate dehydrogenase [Verrucomicrobiae bacterium]|nr:D-glycerate dehydrogenase [Verrucomicrobiae bacterium]
MSWNVFIVRRIPADAAAALRKADVNVDWRDEEDPPARADLFARLHDRDGVIVTGAERVDAAFFDAAPKLKVVSCMAVGYDNVDVAEAARRRVVVTNTPGVLTDACADLTWLLILGVARRVVEADHLTRSGNWRGLSPTAFLGVDVTGKNLGIVGAGRIGAAVAKRATGFSMRILYFARSPKPDMEALGAQRASFDELLRESDFVSVHVPLTPETRHMFGESEFRNMKPTAYFINMSRGTVHDEAALARALREQWIAGAGLDVYEHEPKVDPDLLKMPNALLLPHIGSATVETRRRMALLTVENLLAVLEGRPCPYIVTPA